jgi:hypothetical protein
MSGRFRPIKADHAVITQALTDLETNGDIEAVYRQIITETGQWSTHYFLNKSSVQRDAFKDHVSSIVFVEFHMLYIALLEDYIMFDISK